VPSHNLGSEHQAERIRQLAGLPADGSQPCPRCRRAMFATVALAVAAGASPQLGLLDLDDFPGRVFGGPQVKLLAHRRCNRQAGARLGNRLRGMRRAAGIPSPAPRKPAPRWFTRWLRGAAQPAAAACLRSR
jgi:hypothetical protein